MVSVEVAIPTAMTISSLYFLGIEMSFLLQFSKGQTTRLSLNPFLVHT